VEDGSYQTQTHEHGVKFGITEKMMTLGVEYYSTPQAKIEHKKY
jgi:hypothetical protein